MAKVFFLADKMLKVDLVIAIDIGTSGTAYAFQLKRDYEMDKQSIKDDPFYSQHRFKTSTCLLLKQRSKSDDPKVSYFGSKAEELYLKVKDPTKWYYFRHFKMQIYHNAESQTISRETQIEGHLGKMLPAVDVLSECIQCIRQNIEDYKGGEFKSYFKRSTKWVITVPAIWKDQAKQLMREAAIKAGLLSESIVIALEPEAAAIYYAVSEDSWNLPSDACKDQRHTFAPRTTSVIVDMGGGTVDITAIEIVDNGKLKQVHEAVGGPSGGEEIDSQLISLMSALFGPNLWEEFANDYPKQYAEFISSCKMAKQNLQPKKRHGLIKDDIYLMVSEDLMRKFARNMKEEDLDVAIRKASREIGQSGISLCNGSLSINADVLREIMDVSVKTILDYLYKIIRDVKQITHTGKTVDSVILVGGFAESNYMFELIKQGIESEFGSIKVRRPLNCGIAVLHGAVLFGQDETLLLSRIVRFTYGIKAFRTFTETDPEERKVVEDGTPLIEIFSKHVEKGQEVRIDEWIPGDTTYRQLRKDQTIANINIFASNNTDPKYTNEDGCHHIGHIPIEFDGHDSNQTVGLWFNFGRTEIMVRAKNKQSGRESYKTISLM